MKDIYSNLLRLTLAAGLTQRDLFIEKVSEFLSEKMDSNPETGERIAESFVSLAESLKDELFLRQLFQPRQTSEPADDSALAGQIGELNRTIAELTAVLKQQK